MSKLKIFLISFLVLAGLFDIYTTLIDKNFLAIESNIGVLAFNSMAFILFLKVSLIAYLSWILWTSRYNYNTYTKFFYIYLILSLSVAQLYAGVNNIVVKKDMTEFINEQTGKHYQVNDVPREEIMKYASDKRHQAVAYMQFVSTLLLLPLLVAMSTFILHRKMDVEKCNVQQ